MNANVYMLNGFKLEYTQTVKGRRLIMENMVRVTKKCPNCGATNLYRRVRKGGYHCNKCKLTFNYPTIEKIGRVL